MSKLQFPETIWRVGMYQGDIGQRLAAYNPDFELITTGILPNNLKLGLYIDRPDPYLILVSNLTRRISPNNYNTMLSITSEDSFLNRRVLEEFLKLTELPLTREPDKRFVDMSQLGLGLAFQVFKKHGRTAMSALRM